MFPNIIDIKDKKANEDNSKAGFISTIFEFLYIIFRLSLINFHFKKSKFTLDKTFDDNFNQQIKDDDISFKNFICKLNDELKAIKEFLDSSSNDKDFKPSDLNLDILMSCVNNCFLFYVNTKSYEDLITSLKSSFHDLIKKKKIQLNKESKLIISSFNLNIDKNLKYINEIKGVNVTFNKLEEKEEKNIQQYLDIIKILEKEVSNNKNKLDEKEKEIQDYQKKKEELNLDLSKTKIKSSLDKSTYEGSKKAFSSNVAELLNKHSKEIKALNEKMKNMEKEIKDIKKDNIVLKSKLN